MIRVINQNINSIINIYWKVPFLIEKLSNNIFYVSFCPINLKLLAHIMILIGCVYICMKIKCTGRKRTWSSFILNIIKTRYMKNNETTPVWGLWRISYKL